MRFNEFLNLSGFIEKTAVQLPFFAEGQPLKFCHGFNLLAVLALPCLWGGFLSSTSVQV